MTKETLSGNDTAYSICHRHIDKATKILRQIGQMDHELKLNLQRQYPLLATLVGESLEGDQELLGMLYGKRAGLRRERLLLMHNKHMGWALVLIDKRRLSIQDLISLHKSCL